MSELLPYSESGLSEGSIVSLDSSSCESHKEMLPAWRALVLYRSHRCNDKHANPQVPVCQGIGVSGYQGYLLLGQCADIGHYVNWTRRVIGFPGESLELILACNGAILHYLLI